MEASEFRILIVGGEPAHVPDLNRALSQVSGPRYVVERVETGIEGIKACLEQDRPGPDCAVIDSALPDMSGLEVLTRLRDEAGEVRFPVVMSVDPRHEPGSVKAALRAGAEECIERSAVSADGLALAVRCAAERFELRKQERRQGEDLRGSERRFRRLAASDCIGIVVGDIQGELSYANDEYLRLLGRTREEFDVSPFRWTEITPPEWLEVDRRMIAEALSGFRRVPYEKEYFRKDGSRVPVLVGFALLSDEDDEMVAFVLDLTDRKRAEKALRDADRRKDEFIAMLAHELRNPLAAISTAVHILRMKAPDLPELAWGRDVIARQVKQLSRLIDDLLDVSRMATGKLKLKPVRVDVREVVSRAAEAVQPLIASREHELRIVLPPDPLAAFADPARMEQVVTNLLSNAAKFTECGGRIEVSGGLERELILLRVRDNGVGIAPEALPSIFDLFTQADPSTDRAHGGLGIGLTLVKSLVTMHGGTVEASSEGIGMGSQFTVRIPAVGGDAHAAAHPTEGASDSPARASARSRVLVVDDNEDVVHGLAKLIEAAGHEVRTAHNGPDALDIAREFLPSHVLADIGLPGMDGYELARAFRQDASLDRAVLIAVSGYGQSSDLSRSRAAGFHHHLLKPVEPSTLLPMLASEKGESHQSR
jgi:PAS domain S-box-containing protein